MEKRDFARLEFKMDFRGLYNVVTAPCVPGGGFSHHRVQLGFIGDHSPVRHSDVKRLTAPMWICIEQYKNIPMA